MWGRKALFKRTEYAGWYVCVQLPSVVYHCSHAISQGIHTEDFETAFQLFYPLNMVHFLHSFPWYGWLYLEAVFEGLVHRGMVYILRVHN